MWYRCASVTSVISVSCSVTCDITEDTHNTLRHIQRAAQAAHAWYLLHRNERKTRSHAGPLIFKQVFPWINRVPATQKIYPEIGWIWRSKYFKSDVLRARSQSRHSHLLQKCIRNVCNICECHEWCIRNVCNSHLLMHQECLQFTSADASGMSAIHICWCIRNVCNTHLLMHQERLQVTSITDILIHHTHPLIIKNVAAIHMNAMTHASGKSAIHMYCRYSWYIIHIYCRNASEMSLPYIWMPWLMHQECLLFTSIAHIPMHHERWGAGVEYHFQEI